MQNDFQDRHVVITGGTGGLGVAVLTTLLERGATCHIPCFESEVPSVGLDGYGDRVRFETSIDLAAEDAVKGYYGRLPVLWGSIHLAGGFAMAPVSETSARDLDRMWKMNAVSAFLCCREAAGRMKGGSGGRIVNVSARPAVEPAGGMVAYSMSKAAVAALTQALARELVSDDIAVNAVVPSIIDTPANRASMPDADHDSWPKPVELAEAIAFAASPRNALVSGALLPVYGKML